MLEFGLGSRSLTVALLVGLVLALVAAAPLVAGLRLPGNDIGYEPAQPIAFSHRLHAGDMGIGCLYCHQGAETSRYAGVPAPNTCFNCHRFVTAPLAKVRAEDEAAKKEGRDPKRIVSPELQKLYDTLGLDDQLKRDPNKKVKPLAWVRVHKLPDHVIFPHSRHVNAGLTCQRCHGMVERMERVRQHADLSMGWCVNCHRQVNKDGVDGRKVNASLDCAACHY